VDGLPADQAAAYVTATLIPVVASARDRVVAWRRTAADAIQPLVVDRDTRKGRIDAAQERIVQTMVQATIQKPKHQGGDLWSGINTSSPSKMMVFVRTKRHAPERIPGTLDYAPLLGRFADGGTQKGVNALGVEVQVPLLIDYPEPPEHAAPFVAEFTRGKLAVDELNKKVNDAATAAEAAVAAKAAAAYEAVAARLVALFQAEDTTLLATIPTRVAEAKVGDLLAAWKAEVDAIPAGAEAVQAWETIHTKRLEQVQAVLNKAETSYTSEVAGHAATRRPILAPLVTSDADGVIPMPASLRTVAQGVTAGLPHLVKPLDDALAEVRRGVGPAAEGYLASAVARWNAGVERTARVSESPVAVMPYGEGFLAAHQSIGRDRRLAYRVDYVSVTGTVLRSQDLRQAERTSTMKTGDAWLAAQQARQPTVGQVVFARSEHGLGLIDRLAGTAWAITSDMTRSQIGAGSMSNDERITDLVIGTDAFHELFRAPADSGPRAWINAWQPSGQSDAQAPKPRRVFVTLQGEEGRGTIDYDGKRLQIAPRQLPNGAITARQSEVAWGHRTHQVIHAVTLSSQQPGVPSLRYWVIEDGTAYRAFLDRAIGTGLVVHLNGGAWVVVGDRVEVWRPVTAASP
jgi:hypothetical protein